MRKQNFRTFILFTVTVFYLFFLLPFLFVFPSLHNFMSAFEIAKSVFFVLFLFGLFSILLSLLLSLFPFRYTERIVFWANILLLFYVVALISNNWFREMLAIPGIIVKIVSILLTLAIIAFPLFFIRRKQKGLLTPFNEMIEPINFIFLAIFLISSIFLIVNSGKLFRKSINKPPRENQPNVIIVLFDALSAYHLPVYGYDKIATPHIDEFGDESIVFAPMVAPSNCTALSIPSIMTGKTPYHHKIADFDEYFSPQIKDENILRILKENGYYCYSIVQNPLTALSSFGLQEWIDKEPYPVFIPNVSYRILSCILRLSRISGKMNIYSYPLMKKWIAAAFRARRGGRFELSFSKEIPYNPFQASIPFEKAMDLIEEGNRPFFLFIHVFPPHDPFLPESVEIPEQFNTVQKQAKYLHRPQSEDEIANINALRELYDKNIEYIDREFGVFIEELKNAGVFDISLVILTSDHGETFIPEWVGHNSIYHAYEPMIRVPCIIKLPMNNDHQRINVLTSGLDIAPTILDMIDVEIPTWMEGESLFPFINGEKEDRETPCFCMRIAKYKKHFINNGFIAIFNDKKLVYRVKDGQILCTDPVNDPYDRTDISSDFPGEAQFLQEYLFEYLGITSVPELLQYPQTN